MRKRQSFLLTVLSPENETAPFCGRLKVISSGKTCTFTSLEDLYRLIASEMGDQNLPHLAKYDSNQDSSDKPISLS